MSSVNTNSSPKNTIQPAVNNAQRVETDIININRHALIYLNALYALHALYGAAQDHKHTTEVAGGAQDHKHTTEVAPGKIETRSAKALKTGSSGRGFKVFENLIEKIRLLAATSSSPIVFEGFDYSKCDCPLDKTSFTKRERKNIIENNSYIIQLTQKIKYLTRSLAKTQPMSDPYPSDSDSEDELWSWPLTESGHLDINELKKMCDELRMS